MKTSNIVLFSLMSTFSLIITAGALELRFSGRLSDGNPSHSPNVIKEVDAPLQPFQILVIHESVNLAIEKGDPLSFQVYRNKEDGPSIIQFHQSADTLFIDRIASAENARHLHAVIRLKEPSLLKVIQANHSTFSLEEPGFNALAIQLTESNLYVASALNLQQLRLSATHSEVTYDSGDIEKLEADLDHSSVNIQGTISQFNGRIKNESELQLRVVHQINCSTDSTSSMRIID